MIKYNDNTIGKFNEGRVPILKAYKGGVMCFNNGLEGGTSAPSNVPCFAVTEDLDYYEDRTYTDVYNQADSKWYKLNNLNQYEEYGVYADTTGGTYYEGKLAIVNGHEYEYSGGTWVDLGTVSTMVIKSPEYLERSASANGYMPLGEFFQENTTIEIDFQMTQAKGFCVIGDYFKTDNDDWRMFINYDVVANNKVNYDFLTERGDWNSGNWAQRFNLELGNYYIKNLDTGTNVISRTAKTGFTRPNQMYLFHLDTQEGSSISQPNLDYGHIYSVKIKQNGVLAKEYIPWTDENGNYGLFDKVEKEIHYSIGQMTGSSTVYDVTITGSTSYPKYYATKSAPENNLTFASMALAKQYQCPWVLQQAKIHNKDFYFDYTYSNQDSQIHFG